MANAAAKKAALAKNSTSAVYLPLIIILNFVHIILLYTLSENLTKARIALTLLELIGTFIAYQGILHDAEVGKLTRENKKSTDIPGGLYLDVLGLIVFVQYGSIFIGSIVNWLLLIAPISYALFKWIGQRSVNKDSNYDDNGQDEGLKKELEERRRKRAERRKQKRM